MPPANFEPNLCLPHDLKTIKIKIMLDSKLVLNVVAGAALFALLMWAYNKYAAAPAPTATPAG